jgi:BON domain
MALAHQCPSRSSLINTENQMSFSKTPFLSALALVFASTLPAHAMSAKNASESAIDDAKIKADVQTSLDENAGVGPPNSIRVQAVDHVVYLHGLVDTGLEKWIAGSIASRTPGVEEVVNSIEQNN